MVVNFYFIRVCFFWIWVVVIWIVEVFFRGLEVKKIDKIVFCVLIFVVRGGDEVGVVIVSWVFLVYD